MYEFVLSTAGFGEPDLENEHARGRARTRLAPLPTPDDVERETRSADGVIVATNEFGATHISRLGPRVRIIGRAGVGLDSVDLEAAAARGVAVLHVPDYATREVANHAVAMILALHRRLLEADQVARADWSGWRSIGVIPPLEESVVGLVGYGRIGRAVAERLAGLGPRIQAFDPLVASDPSAIAELVDLPQLLHTSDIVSLHLPLTAETAGVIGRAELAAMKPGAILVNVSRGGLVDEAALVEALAAGRLGSAGLDVLRQEPPPPDADVLAAPRLLLSPHVAWYSTGSERRLRTDTVGGMIDYLDGVPLRTGRLAADPQRPTVV